MCKKQCEMRQINMQKTVRNAANLHAKNTAKCGKFTCKKHCEMRQIYMQKTLRNAANLHAKNTAKCVTFPQIFYIFFAYEFGAIFSVFCREICRKLYGNFLYVSSFFVMIFMGPCAGMGRAG